MYLRVCTFIFLAIKSVPSFAADCVYTNVINYNAAGEIVGATQKYECKTPPPKTMVNIDPFRTPVEIIYDESYYNSSEEEDERKLQNLYEVFSLISALGQ